MNVRPTRVARKYCFQTSRHSSSCASRRRTDSGSTGTPASFIRPRRRLDLGQHLRFHRSGAHCATITARPSPARMSVSAVPNLHPARELPDGVRHHLRRLERQTSI